MKMESKKRAIDKIYKRRDRYDIPDWQRGEVWSRSKKQNLIDSILRQWKLPKFYFLLVADDPEEYEVVDGQQRLTTIFEFFDNQLSLASETADEFGGHFYKELPDNVSDAFDDYEIEFDKIEDAKEEEVKQFFQRLQDGLSLTSAEKLNSIHSELRNYLHKLIKDDFFKKVRASNHRYGHFDILAKVAAIEIDGWEVGLRYDDLRAVFESQSTFSSTSNVARRLKKVLEFVNTGFDDEAARILRNRTVVQSLLTLVCQLIRSKSTTGAEERVCKFYIGFLHMLNKQVELGQQATDHDYLKFQRTINANIKDGPWIRQQILLRKLFANDPGFAELMDPAMIADTGFRGAITADAREIAKLIAEKNEQYSAANGEDLFKATNKTTKAQANLGHPIDDYDGYKGLIDDLYFLFRESIGNRLDVRVPQSFQDVNDLRTDLRHDLDHGKEGKVKSKRKKTGKTFKKYAGAPSPEGIDPNRFVVVQANLLSAIVQDLRSLAP